MKHTILLLALCSGCDLAWARVEKVECPVEVPADLIAAYFGCEYDPKKMVSKCPQGTIAPQKLVLDALDIVPPPDAGADE